MGAATTILFVCLGVGIFVLLLLFVQFRLRDRALEVVRRFDAQEVRRVTSRDNFFGLESKGMGQVRGNGVLLLTDNVLFFEMLLPKRAFTVPLQAITAIETPRSHLGKAIMRPLLKVVFTNEDGGTDSIAWWVADLEEWVTHLEQITGLGAAD